MSRWRGKTCRLTTMMVLTSSFFLVEIVVGTLTNSIALVADSFHMLSDLVALLVGFASVRISKWKTKRNTYGWQRAEVLGALVNSVFLLALCFSIVIESVKRLVQVEEVESPVMLLIVGALGLLVNIFGLFLFGEHGHSHGGGGGHNHGHGHSHGGGQRHSHGKSGENGSLRQDNGEGLQDMNNREMTSLQPKGAAENMQRLSSGQISVTATSTTTESTLDDKEIYQVDNEARTEVIKHSGGSSSESLNMRGVFLHVLGDALGSVVVIVSALTIWFVEEDWKYYLDPAMSILMVLIILSTTIPLFRESAYILLQTVPRHVNVDAITRELRDIDGIAGVHECHIWQLAGRRIIASAHVHCKDIMEYMVLANKIKKVFHRAGIHSTTIQPEFPVHPGDDQLTCSFVCNTDGGDKCEQDTCCGPRPGVKGRQNGYNNSNISDATQPLTAAVADPADQDHQRSSTWSIPIEMSPEGDEVVLDLSKTEG